MTQSINNIIHLICYTNMIKNIIDLLNTSEHYNTTDKIDMAKGKKEIPNDWKDVWYKIKRYSKIEKKPFGWSDVWNKLKNLKWQIRK